MRKEEPNPLEYLWDRIARTDANNKLLEEQLGLLRQEYSKQQTKLMNAEAKAASAPPHRLLSLVEELREAYHDENQLRFSRLIKELGDWNGEY